MVEYSKVNVKLSDTQLKTAVENKTGTTLRMSLKMFNGNDLPHELLLTTRQKAELRNAFNNNMSTDLKLSKAQISKLIQCEEFLGRLLGPLLTLFRMGFFGAGHGWGGTLPKICHTYPTMMKLGTVIPYLRKIKKIYKSRDTSLEFC